MSEGLEQNAVAEQARPDASAGGAGIDPYALLAWYERHARKLPWRVGPQARRSGARPDPYRVWLSEIMLQQTNVKAVEPYYRVFLERWPRVENLAAAPDADIMAAWAGLGYYSRARNLLACARTIVSERGGAFPRSAAELRRLPGIGPYTAGAIASIAFGERAAAIDGNVERVIARVRAIDVALPAARPLIRAALEPLVPADRPGEFAEALMDLGATICTPRKPACALCPWFAGCRARLEGRPETYPRKAPKRARPTRFGAAFVAVRCDGAMLLRRRPPRGLLGGMVEVPGTQWLAEAQADVAPPVPGRWIETPAPVTHGFTHFDLVLTVWRGEVEADASLPQGHWWEPAASLAQAGLPTLMRKVVEAASEALQGR